MKRKVSELVKSNYCSFSHLRRGMLYYTISENVDPRTVNTYMFPIPITELGDSSINVREKAIKLIVWIKKAIKEDTFLFYSQIKL